MTSYSNALVGYTGYVGSNILEQESFSFLYNSKNIHQINDKYFDLIICSGAPGIKWKANKNADADYRTVKKLIDCLSTVEAKKIVLISTIDVYDIVDRVNENSPIDKNKLNPYGKHRRILEEFISENFDSIIIRLPGLFSKKMSSGILYDFISKNHKFLPVEGKVQLYNLDNIWEDIQIAVNNDLKEINFAIEPIRIKELARLFNYQHKKNAGFSKPYYDMQTIHSQAWGKDGPYLYSKLEVLKNIKLISAKSFH